MRVVGKATKDKALESRNIKMENLLVNLSTMRNMAWEFASILSLMVLTNLLVLG
jgi:predicted DNA-binding transcriptional regulator